MKRFSVMVKGHVQGVGFRSFVETEASHYNVTGNVRNEDNGQVAIQVQGKETELHSFLETIKQGNRFSSVEELSYTEIDTERNEQDFRTVY
ncbi:acylphosphatase [Shouchella sp. 1P09AA]|uniref:acylphosphatase n=1 Tax=unclassified Shouchella TaxID=2893065 RepID=UPI0039A0EF24